MSQTTTERQFSTAKKFAAHMLTLLRPSYVQTLNDMRGDDRLSRLIDAVERYVRWPLADGGIEQRYNGAILGFHSAFSRCLDAETYLVVSKWTTRQMLEALHTLMVTHEAYSPHEYAANLTIMVKEMEGQK